MEGEFRTKYNYFVQRKGVMWGQSSQTVTSLWPPFPCQLWLVSRGCLISTGTGGSDTHRSSDASLIKAKSECVCVCVFYCIAFVKLGSDYLPHNLVQTTSLSNLLHFVALNKVVGLWLDYAVGLWHFLCLLWFCSSWKCWEALLSSFTHCSRYFHYFSVSISVACNHRINILKINLDAHGFDNELFWPSSD